MIGCAAGCGDAGQPPSATAAPHFVSETAGIEHRYDGDFQYFVGGGWPRSTATTTAGELYLAGGSEPAALYRNRSPGGALRFRSRGVTRHRSRRGDRRLPARYRRDRHADLAVLRLGEDVVLRGLGWCRFERANEALGIDGGDAWTTGVQRTWEGPTTCRRWRSVTT